MAELKKKSKSAKKKPVRYHWVDKKILVVEDMEVNHMLIDRILQFTSASVLWAMDGETAVELCEIHDDIDCVLMDLRLPKMDGYEATKRIRKMRPDLPIIVQTAYLRISEKSKVLEVGANDLVPKPIDKALLLSTMSKYIDKKKKN